MPITMRMDHNCAVRDDHRGPQFCGIGKIIAGPTTTSLLISTQDSSESEELVAIAKCAANGSIDTAKLRLAADKDLAKAIAAWDKLAAEGE